MIKRSIQIILLMALQTVALSQGKQSIKPIESGKIDSLKQKLAQANDDSTRLKILNLIGFAYEVLNVDSSMKYARTGLALAKKPGNGWAEAGLMTNLASVLR